MEDDDMETTTTSAQQPTTLTTEQVPSTTTTIMSEELLPMYHMTPNLFTLGSRLSSQIPYPQLKSGPYYNLIKNNDSVKTLMNLSDRNLVASMYEVFESGLSLKSYQLNSTAARIEKRDLSNVSTSKLLSAFLDHDSQRGTQQSLIGTSENEPMITTEQIKSLRKTRASTTTNSNNKKQTLQEQSNIQDISEDNHFYDEFNLRRNRRRGKDDGNADIEINAQAIAKVLTVSSEEIESLEGALDEVFAWENSKTTDEEALPHSLMQKLEKEIGLALKRHYLSKCNQDTLCKLVQLLSTEVSNSDMDIQRCEKDLEQINSMVFRMNGGLSCCILLLKIISAPKLAKTLAEEAPDAIISILKSIVNHYLYPSLSAVAIQEEAEAAEASSPSDKSKPKKRRKTLKSTSTKSVLVIPSTTITQIGESFNLFVTLMRKMKLKDEVVIPLSDLALSTFFVEGIQSIQLSALNVATCIFSGYHEHRKSMFHYIICSIVKLPHEKRAVKAYKLENHSSIQVFTSLMLQLIQSCGASASMYHDRVKETNRILDFDAEEKEVTKSEKNSETEADKVTSEENDEFTADKIDEVVMKDLYDQSMSCAKIFVEFFASRCLPSETTDLKNEVDGNTRLIIDHFVDDLITAVELPSWPAADLVLQALTRHLCEEYLNKPKKSEKVRLLCVDVLGRVALVSKQHEMKKNQILNGNNEPDSEEEEQIYNRQDMSPRPKRRQVQNHALDKLVADIKQRYAIDEPQLKKINLFVYLSTLVKKQQSMFYARQFSLCQWLWDNSKDDKKTFYAELWKKDPLEFSNCRIMLDSAVSDYEHTLCQREASIVNRFDYLFKEIMQTIQDDKVNIRARAIENLLKVIEVDSTLLSMETVKNCIRSRSADHAKRVREVVIKLIGKTILTPDVVPDEFFIKLVIDRVRDAGLSVRKRAIQILGDVCQNTKLPESYVVEICRAFSARLNTDNNEEDTVKKIVLKSFEKIWFASSQTNMQSTALQIVDVVARQKCDPQLFNDHWLVQMIRTSNLSTMESSVKAIFESLLNHVISMTNDSVTDIGRNNITSCFQLLHLICFADPKFGATTFKPLCNFLDEQYVSGETPKPNLIFHVSSILGLIIPEVQHLTKLDSEKTHVNTLLRKLHFLIFTAPNMVADAIESCVKCLAVLCEKVNNSTFVLKNLKGIQQLLSTTPKQVNANADRLVVILGFLVKHYDFDKYMPGANCLDDTLKLLLRLSSERTSLEAHLTRSLFNIIVRKPTLSRDKKLNEVIRRALSETASERTNLLALNGITEFLYNEQLKMETQGTTGQNCDSGITTSFMSGYIKDILRLVGSMKDEVRLAALKAIEHVARQGLYIPELIIPAVVTLEADPLQIIREKAHALNVLYENKHHALLVSNSAKGIINSYSALRRLGQSPDVSGVREVGVGFYSDFYKIAHKFTKKERQSFLHSLLREAFKVFDNKSNKDRLQALRYVMEIVALLPYEKLFEVAKVISDICTYVDEKGDEKVGSLKSKLTENSDEDSDMSDDDIDPLSSVTNLSLRDSAINAVGIYLLVQTKNYLQEAHSISNKKLDDFIQNETDNSFNRVCTPSSVTKATIEPFRKIVLATTSLSSSSVFDKNLKNIYQLCARSLSDHTHKVIDVQSRRTPPKKAANKRTSPATSRKTSPATRKKTTTKKRGTKKKRTHKQDDEEEEGWVSGDSDNDRDIDLETSSEAEDDDEQNESSDDEESEPEEEESEDDPSPAKAPRVRKQSKRKN